jgi:hypothetical protein
MVKTMKFSDLEVGKLYVVGNDDDTKDCLIRCEEIFKDYAYFKVVKGNDAYYEGSLLNYGEKFISDERFKLLPLTKDDVHVSEMDMYCRDEYMAYRESKKEEERVNHPRHYNQGIEAIEYIESHHMDFNEGNVIKYLTRAKYKGTYLEDLKKARWYLNRLIDKGQNNED